MAHLLRGKQAGIQKDLSLSVAPELFALDDVSQASILCVLRQLTTWTLVCAVWRQLPDFYPGIRSRSVTTGSWDQ
jgi:hypothetical protein